jgi:hypothetical protein
MVLIHLNGYGIASKKLMTIPSTESKNCYPSKQKTREINFNGQDVVYRRDTIVLAFLPAYRCVREML